jgi:hypothetical protein
MMMTHVTWEELKMHFNKIKEIFRILFYSVQMVQSVLIVSGVFDFVISVLALKC